VARALIAAGREICGHGYGWEEFHGATRDEERDNIRLAGAHHRSAAARQVDIARWWLEHQPPALRSSP
jgi:peptidoglycan/xylan/chitin deacetylase (PgdA/CDA1 family)